MVVFLLLPLVVHRASAQLVLTEFVADNVLGLKDDDGDVEDWIEIHNPGSTAVDLAGWRLTDDPADPTKWIFPAQNLGPREYLVVFASGKDRRVPGRTWHTNFRLSGAGEYLALVRPDGTVATAFAPSYPAQVADVAYGAESATVPEFWVRTGSDAHWHVPAGDTLGSAWPRMDFADAEWARGPLGVGWDQSTNQAQVVVAHSEEDWSAGGEQGFRGWHYGYYARSRDSDGTYSAADFIPFPAGFWDGVQWRSPGGVAPWDRITRTTARPTGSNSGGERWVIRRWISSVAGELNVTWHLAKQETSGSGVSARIFFKGEQHDSEILAAANTTGVTRVVRLTGVQVGDPIDLALIPAGAAGSTDDLGDDSVFGFEVSAPGAFSSWIRSDFAAAMRARNATAYVRVPFLLTPDQVAEVESLDLHVRYDDGFAAFLNGEFVVSRNAPLQTTGGVIADSLLDWASEGVQGKNGWYYGLYRRADDADGIYDPGSEFENADPLWTWNGDGWELGPGDPPWTAITRETWHPNGNGGGDAVQWAIRRWVSQAEGAVRVALAGAKQNPGCGNGVTFRVLFNGEERFARTLGFQDTQGFATTIELENVQFGDLVDFVLDPTGTDGDTADGCDGSTFAAQISQEASEPLAWNSVALRSRTREEAVRESVFSLARVREHLVAGTNVLAFQVLNAAADDDDLLLAPELVARRALTGGAAWRYFVAPTPGGANTGGTESLGPVVVEVAHEPAIPEDTQPLSVRALVRRTVGNVASVQLSYRVMYGAEVTVDMADDGAHGDGAVGDGWWGAVIPASASTPGQMIRWAVLARDGEGRVLRSPAYADPRRTPQYYGTVVRDPATDRSNLPVLSWFLQNAAAADGDTGTRGSLFYDGEFYDNVGANLHGQSTRGFPKKSYDLDFNPGHHFRWQRGQPRVDDLNLLTTWADKSHFRTPMAYETYAEAGAPAHFAFPVRVQLNGRFHAVANLVENGDENFLERLGLDPLGALYKMYNTADSTSGAEKKTRKFEGSQDLGALLSALAAGSAQAKESVLFDQLDVPEVVNYLAARAVTADTDCCHKNYYLYRDTRNSGEWLAFPWDVDLSFGRVWTCDSPCFSYFDETIYTNTGLFVGDNNRVFSLILSTASTRQMYLRRVRTLMDRLTQPPEVAPSADRWRLRSTQWRDRIAPDAALDLAKWGTWGRRETITQAVDRIHREFLPGRRRYAFQTLVNAGTLPAAQSSNVVVRFATLEARSPSGLPSHEYLCLTNANPVAVDLSDWRLAGAVRLRFKPGTVLPARSAAYVSPDRRAFRARSTSPKGGERRLVLGNYEGELTARGGIVELWDDAGRRVAETTLPTQPSAAQQFLRVTELMYDPPPGGAEYVELLNTGATSLSLAGVRFTAGIIWAFPTLDAPSLAPGERIVLVEDLARFRATYGAGPRVGGVFAGSLDNAGERVRLEDAAGEAILDFEFPGSGHPAADDLGFSLVISDPLASWERWDNADFWRVSAVPGGTPASAELVAGPGMPVVIDEVLTHTDPPLLDAVELFNSGTTPVTLDGWWLTDDPGTPQKYRFPPGTVLDAGARLVVDESQLNAPGSPTAFTFSSHGDEVWLFRADATGRLTGDADGFSFPAAANGVSFGRHTNSAGKLSFPAQRTRTLGAPNSGPAIGPVIFHEIHARPPRGEMPFLELRNVSTTEVALHDPAHPTNTWRISGVDYEFPPGFVMPPGGTLLVVGGDPVDFRIRWQS
ncbi:MAG: lamin tail domain-containing protein, partial [Verrucomicrobiales bacterium]|nr:lamin tail domain-containing protein [Verrucomicrobiales bacterium]